MVRQTRRFQKRKQTRRCYLINSTRNEAMDVLVFSKYLWKCGAKSRGCLHSWETHFTYRKKNP